MRPNPFPTDLWQRRFWEHVIRNDTDYENHVDYVHWNPVKHGLVKKVSDWPFSSFHRYVQAGMLPIDWVGDVESEKNDYGERHKE
jgi:putative transposase